LVLQPTPLHEPVADLGFLNGDGATAEGTKIEVPQTPRGMGRGGAVPRLCPSQKFFFNLWS